MVEVIKVPSGKAGVRARVRQEELASLHHRRIERIR